MDDVFDASAAVRKAQTLYPTRAAITAESLHSQCRAILAGIDRR